MEGPYISEEKKGAHPADYILSEHQGIESLLDTYGSLDNTKIITLAPEIAHSMEIILELKNRGIVVSVGTFI